jgi:heme/copper-type cytochrome/quinol oxidase subunit 1
MRYQYTVFHKRYCWTKYLEWLKEIQWRRVQQRFVRVFCALWIVQWAHFSVTVDTVEFLLSPRRRQLRIQYQSLQDVGLSLTNIWGSVTESIILIVGDLLLTVDAAEVWTESQISEMRWQLARLWQISPVPTIDCENGLDEESRKGML